MPIETPLQIRHNQVMQTIANAAEEFAIPVDHVVYDVEQQTYTVWTAEAKPRRFVISQDNHALTITDEIVFDEYPPNQPSPDCSSFLDLLDNP